MERRVVKIPRKYGIVDLISYAPTVADEVNGEEPMNFKEVISSGDKLKWFAATQDEITCPKKTS